MRHIVLVLLGLVLCACSSAAPEPRGASSSPPSPTSPVARTLDERLADAEEDVAVYDGIVDGISVAIAQDGEVRTLVHGPGVEDPRDRFMIASLSKPMVAAAVLSLVASGDLALDDTVGEIAPGLLPRANGVTVEQLLSMSSGLADFQSEPRYRGPFTTSSKALVALIARERLEFEPGARGAYTNTNFAVLDVIVQRVTGGSLARLLDRAVLSPAHLDRTSLGDPPDVAGTTSEDQPYRPRIVAPSAGAGIVASAEDVARFFEALAAGALIPDDLVDAMLAEHATVDFGSYGLGITRESTPCGEAYGHVGNNDGFESAGWTIPDLGRTVVVLVDAANAGAAQAVAAHALCD